MINVFNCENTTSDFGFPPRELALHVEKHVHALITEGSGIGELQGCNPHCSKVNSRIKPEIRAKKTYRKDKLCTVGLFCLAAIACSVYSYF